MSGNYLTNQKQLGKRSIEPILGLAGFLKLQRACRTAVIKRKYEGKGVMDYVEDHKEIIEEIFLAVPEIRRSFPDPPALAQKVLWDVYKEQAKILRYHPTSRKPGRSADEADVMLPDSSRNLIPISEPGVQTAFDMPIPVNPEPLPINNTQQIVHDNGSGRTCNISILDFQESGPDKINWSLLWEILGEDLQVSESNYKLFYYMYGEEFTISNVRHVNTAIRSQANLGLRVGKWHGIGKKVTPATEAMTDQTDDVIETGAKVCGFDTPASSGRRRGRRGATVTTDSSYNDEVSGTESGVHSDTTDDFSGSETSNFTEIGTTTKLSGTPINSKTRTTVTTRMMTAPRPGTTISKTTLAKTLAIIEGSTSTVLSDTCKRRRPQRSRPSEFTNSANFGKDRQSEPFEESIQNINKRRKMIKRALS